MKKMRCCGHAVHVKCLRRWKLFVKEESSSFANTQRCPPYEYQEQKEILTDLSFHVDEKRNASTFNGQMNYPAKKKPKYPRTNQDLNYRDNLEE